MLEVIATCLEDAKRIERGGGVTKENVQQLLNDTGITQTHVGTAVREGKSYFGEVIVQNIQEIAKLTI